ncbi:unnamed protein product [Rhodiola kirilowii]
MDWQNLFWSVFGIVIIKNGGIDSKADYPYKANDGKCDTYRKILVLGMKMFRSTAKVANQPIAVVIEAGGRAFQLYQSGVFTGTCGTALDHGVAAVGYGTDNGKDY